MGKVLSDDERDRINKEFEKFKKTQYTKQDYEKVVNNEKKLFNLFNKNQLRLYAEYVKLFISMVKDYFTGKYKEVPYGIIAAIVGTLLYVIAPLDIIPDVLPAIGLADDAAIVAMCVAFVAIDVDRYREWKSIHEE